MIKIVAAPLSLLENLGGGGQQVKRSSDPIFIS
jgi:hypothetical protein